MHSAETVSAQVWLDVWEAAARLPPGLREAELLRPACAGQSAEELARLPLGQRDGLLLELRRALFGDHMQCLTACPACNERCEWTCTAESLQVRSAEARISPDHEWSDGSWTVRFRPPSGRDLAALRGSPDEAAAARRLLELCVLAATHDGEPVAADALPDGVADDIARAVGQADPQTALSLSLACPACRHEWEPDFDIGAFLWAEFNAWAQRTLADVHRLATQYRWSERDILSLSPARRALYLAMGST